LPGVLYAIIRETLYFGELPRQVWLPIVFLAALVLNFIYLWFSKPNGEGFEGRIGRLISLWLDAKEAELRKRANKEK
jgi:hypothetical protein